MSRFSRLFEPLYARWRADIKLFATEGLNFVYTWQQEELFDLVQLEADLPEEKRKKRIAVASGQGPGKTAASNVVALWRCIRYPNAICVVTAPSMRQCKQWIDETKRLIASAHKLLKKFIVVFDTMVRINNIKIWGIRTATATRPENLQGIHEKRLTFIADEASGVAPKIMETIKGTLSNPDALFLAIGNPNCVVAETEIYDPENGRVRADAYKKGKVVSADEDRLTLHTANATGSYSGKKKCVELLTRGGVQIELSTDHPVLTPEGWVPAGQLKLKDLVAVPRSLPAPTKIWECEDEEVELVGYVLTDGTTMHGLGFCNMPGVTLDRFVALVEHFGGRSLVRADARSKAHSVNTSGMRDWVCRMGLWGHNAHDKRVPQEYYLLPDRQIPILLRAMWACDGSFNRYGPKMSLCNKRLLEDVRVLLLRLGIYANIWHSHTRTILPQGGEFEGDYWCLAVTEQDSLELWSKLIGDIPGKEKNAWTIYGKKHKRPSGNNPNKDSVPLLWEDYKHIAFKIDRGQRKYSRGRFLSRPAFKQMCDEAGHKGEELRFLRDVRWEQIKTIRKTGMKPVYDLTVPKYGNFVADGMVIHNTISCDFYNCFTAQRDQWHCLKWNAEHTARDYPHIVSPSRNKALEKEYGKDSDVYRIRVLGEFPNSDPNTIMAIDDLVYCTRTSIQGCASNTEILPMHKAFGIDFARYGTDASVVARRVGLAIVGLRSFNKTEPISVVDYAFREQYDHNWKNEDCWYVPDAAGMGQGIMHSFHEAGKQVYEFQSHSRPHDGTMFADQISEAWFNLRGLVREHICHLPNRARLLKQLSTRQYYTDRKGKLKVESKDEWRDRLEIEESPDEADAVVQAFYPHVGATGNVAFAKRQSHTVGTGIRRQR